VNTARRQQGAVLIVGLIILVILTILGINSIQTTTLEERMAGNTLSANAAFQATEAALRQGEQTIVNYGNTIPRPLPSTDGSTNLWVLESPDPDTGSAVQPWWGEANATWWAANGVEYVTPSASVDLEYAAGSAPAALPHHLIEEHQFIKDTLTLGQANDTAGRQFFQITASGTDVSGSATAILRSTYARRF
jgi:type IV pilus assembly protein PilX